MTFWVLVAFDTHQSPSRFDGSLLTARLMMAALD